jgi:hypothetical protein
MSDLEYKHNYPFILNVTYQTIVADSIAPQTPFFAMQRLSPLPRVFRRLQTFAQEPLDRLLGGTAELADLLFGCAGNLNPP